MEDTATWPVGSGGARDGFPSFLLPFDFRLGVSKLACGPKPVATGFCEQSFVGAWGARSLVPHSSVATFALYLQR